MSTKQEIPKEPLTKTARKLLGLVRYEAKRKQTLEVWLSDRQASGRSGMHNQHLLKASQIELKAAGLVDIIQGRHGARYELKGAIYE